MHKEKVTVDLKIICHLFIIAPVHLIQQVLTIKIYNPMHLSIAMRSFFKNLIKNLNQHIVVCRNEEC